MQCIPIGTASCITTLIYTMVDVYLLMVPSFSMSTAKCIFTCIHPMVQFQLLNGTCIFYEYRYSFIYVHLLRCLLSAS